MVNGGMKEFACQIDGDLKRLLGEWQEYEYFWMLSLKTLIEIKKKRRNSPSKSTQNFRPSFAPFERHSVNKNRKKIEQKNKFPNNK
jgi:hypothetical protein